MGSKGQHRLQGSKPKLTKEERRAKYTQIARDRQAKKRSLQNNAKLTCFHCRQKGHALADCPQRSTVNICFKCGSAEHALAICPVLKGRNWRDVELPFATCFVCKEKGHLAFNCPQNNNGIYINGGCCRYCGSKYHVANACPDKQQQSKPKKSEIPEEDVEDLLEPPRTQTKQEKKKAAKRSVVNF